MREKLDKKQSIIEKLRRGRKQGESDSKENVRLSSTIHYNTNY